jgi:hypothetical protein
MKDDAQEGGHEQSARIVESFIEGTDDEIAELLAEVVKAIRLSQDTSSSASCRTGACVRSSLSGRGCGHRCRQPWWGQHEGIPAGGPRHDPEALDGHRLPGRYMANGDHVDAAQGLLVQHRRLAAVDGTFVNRTGLRLAPGLRHEPPFADLRRQAHQRGMHRHREGQGRFDGLPLHIAELPFGGDQRQGAEDAN